MRGHNLLPADDPASVESLLRLSRHVERAEERPDLTPVRGVRPSGLLRKAEERQRRLEKAEDVAYVPGPKGKPVAVPREELERASALRDYERIADLLERMPPEMYIEYADAGRLGDGQLAWLHRHGYEPERVRLAYEAAVDRSREPTPQSVTAGAKLPSAPAVPAPTGATVGLTAADRRGALLNVVRARAAGLDPDRFYPGWRERLR